ncbi:MAG TPA: MaoC family dehydratase [Methylovirgula sp.]|nr:MaoC family dehydratase [Methylovirgula sp.]
MSHENSPRLGEKIASRRLCFGLADLAAYAAVSGDDNPIHLDEALAERAGLEAPPVHGMLLMAAFEPAIAAWRADWILQKLSAKFLRPVLAGEQVEFSGRVVEVGTYVLLRLLAHNEKREIVVIAEATLTQRSADAAP